VTTTFATIGSTQRTSDLGLPPRTRWRLRQARARREHSREPPPSQSGALQMPFAGGSTLVEGEV
jgi:hypothetical protein